MKISLDENFLLESATAERLYHDFNKDMRFVGMKTDFQSLLSYTRHEYVRRILCNIIGEGVEKGEIPHDAVWKGKIIGNIAFHNICDCLEMDY